MYPVNLALQKKLCVVVGGGSVAERKVLGLLDAGALVRVISPELTPALQNLAQEGRIAWLQKTFAASEGAAGNAPNDLPDLAGALLVFAATSVPAVQGAVLAAAQQAGCLVNVADAPAQCDFHVPAVVRRGDLLFTVSTSGKSPALAAALKSRLEREIGVEYARLVTLLGVLRSEVLALPLSGAEKKMLFQKLLDSDIIQWIREERKDLLAAHVQEVFGHLVPVEHALHRLWTNETP